jgi:hypothetical protein
MVAQCHGDRTDTMQDKTALQITHALLRYHAIKAER